MEGLIARMLDNCICYTVRLPEGEGMVLSCRDWTTSLITYPDEQVGR
jgi:hypothetical protein